MSSRYVSLIFVLLGIGLIASPPARSEDPPRLVYTSPALPPPPGPPRTTDSEVSAKLREDGESPSLSSVSAILRTIIDPDITANMRDKAYYNMLSFRPFGFRTQNQILDFVLETPTDKLQLIDAENLIEPISELPILELTTLKKLSLILDRDDLKDTAVLPAATTLLRYENFKKKALYRLEMIAKNSLSFEARVRAAEALLETPRAFYGNDVLVALAQEKEPSDLILRDLIAEDYFPIKNASKAVLRNVLLTNKDRVIKLKTLVSKVKATFPEPDFINAVLCGRELAYLK